MYRPPNATIELKRNIHPQCYDYLWMINDNDNLQEKEDYGASGVLS